MNLNRRDFIRIGSATGAGALASRFGRSGRRAVYSKPQYSLIGGAASDSVLVNTVLSTKDVNKTVDLAVSSDPEFGSYQLAGAQQADGDAIVRHEVSGLAPDTAYYGQLVSESQPVGDMLRFKTYPDATQSWTRSIALVSCMGNASNEGTTEIPWLDIVDWAPDEIWHVGDWGYWGQLISKNDSYKKDIYHYTRSMREFPAMRRAFQTAEMNVVTISDHEISVGGDPEGGIHDSPESIREMVAFQKLMPVRQYGDTRTPIRGRYYGFDIGNQVRVLVTDFRSPDRSNDMDPDGPKKTLFGQNQLSWLLSSLDRTKVNLIVNETTWLANPNQKGRAHDKPWFYRYEQQQIADYITRGGYKVAWLAGDRHYVGYLAGSQNSVGGFPCYVGSGMGKDSLMLQDGELMTWQYGGDFKDKRVVVGYMQLTLSYDAASGRVSLDGLGRAVMDTTVAQSQWFMENIPGGTASDSWKL